MLQGTAIRMAAIMGLHRELSYTLEVGASPEEHIRSEMARRTFWLVYSTSAFCCVH
jgi:hypothetical protein